VPVAGESIGVYVCTYRRNELLSRLLDSLAVAAERVAERATVGVVVVDDNDDGRARVVADAFRHRFPGGLRYRHTGSGNIAVARNAGLEAAIEGTDWVAMTDDDAVVPPDWFVNLLRVQAETGADAVTGSTLLRFPEDSPRWLTEQPFSQIGLLAYPDRAEVAVCSTCNSMLRSSFLRDRPGLRFDPALGRLGGEDGVFYRAAAAAGLRAVYAAEVVVWGEEPAERATFGYQLSRALWLGNSEAIVNHRSGAASRPRLVARGGRRMARAVIRPVRRVASGRPPQLRYTAAEVAQWTGMLLGAAGVELRHR
jgi:succinoglycan biosynthesis protein ExoM